MKKETKSRWMLYLKILANYLLAAAGVLLLIFAVPPLISFFWPLLIGWIIALIANPLVRFLESKLKILRKHGSVIVIVFTLAIVIGIMYLLVYILFKQGMSFAKNFPTMYEDTTRSIQETADKLNNKYTFFPSGVKNFLASAGESIGEIVDSIINDVTNRSHITISGSLNLVKSIAEGLLMTIFTILFSYFLTAEHDKISKFYKEKFPESIKNGLSVISNSIATAFGGYFKA